MRLIVFFSVILLAEATYENFLVNNRLPKCADPNNPYTQSSSDYLTSRYQPRLGLSFFVPAGYWDSIPPDQRFVDLINQDSHEQNPCSKCQQAAPLCSPL